MPYEACPHQEEEEIMLFDETSDEDDGETVRFAGYGRILTTASASSSQHICGTQDSGFGSQPQLYRSESRKRPSQEGLELGRSPKLSRLSTDVELNERWQDGKNLATGQTVFGEVTPLPSAQQEDEEDDPFAALGW